MTFSRRSRQRIARETRKSEQSITPQHRQRWRRQPPASGGGGNALIVAKHNQELPKAILASDPDDVVVEAVEVTLFKLVPIDPEETKPGKPGQYKFEPLFRQAVVANFSDTHAIPSNTWFLVLRTNSIIQAATVWAC